MLEPVFIHKVTPNDNPKFVKTEAIHYTRGSKLAKTAVWERIVSHDTVHILVNNIDTKELLLVKQVRLPVLAKGNHVDGVTIEACAGIIDKYLSVYTSPLNRAQLIAIDEVREELGYLTVSTRLTKLPLYINSTGGSAATAYPFYCEVTDADYLGQQLEDSEDIAVLALPYSEVKEFLANTTNTDASTRYLLQWFLLNKDN